MEAQKINRRNLLKKGLLTFAGLSLMPKDTWANLVETAQKKGEHYLFEHSYSFNEFTPPLFNSEESLLTILRSNENPYGPPPIALEAFKNEAFKGNRYAWKTLDGLKEKIAKKEGVTPDQILMGPGSSDLLEKTAMVLFQHGGDVISADPSYMSLMVVAQSVGGKWKSYKLLEDSQHDLDAMEAGIDENTKLVYICNPNNPTGSITDAKKLYDFCDRVSEKVTVFVDEAYIELSKNGIKDSVVSLVAKGKDVIVLRTFSKIHGMAGLRIGYILGKEGTLKKISDVTRGGMGITAPSIAAASTSMDGKEFLEDCKQKITEARDYTASYLNKKKYTVLPSETNFLIFEISMNGKEFLEKIYAKNVAVRAFNFWDKNWCRVSIGTLNEMKIFTTALEDIMA